MTATSMSATIEKIREEAASFENRDVLLCFSQKKQFQSPLLFDNADQFFETWQNEASPRALESFFPISAKYSEEHKKSDLDKFHRILKAKSEDFGNQDLYMAMGFIKWGEKSLAPALLIPLHYDAEHDTVAISSHAPIENIALPTLDSSIRFPIAADFSKNGNFAIKKFFDTLEKKIAHKTEWKFTRNGCCIAFYSTNRLLLKKNLASESWTTAKVANNDFFTATIGNGGFLPQPSLFESTPYDHVFNPANHYFPYVTDSQTTKAAIDALNEKTFAYAIQTLPGSDKAKVAVNIVADLIQQKKKVCVISRRAITRQNFENAWKPPFRSFQGPDRNELQQKLNECREKLVSYYDSVNLPLKPSGVKLTELLNEIAALKRTKTKFPSDLFKNVEKVRYMNFKTIQASLEQIIHLFFEKNGIEIYKAFQGIKFPAVSNDRKNMIGEDLNNAKTLLEKITPFFESIRKSNLSPDGFNLSEVQDLIALFKKNFDTDMPGFEGWNLHSNGWVAYQDDLTDLPNSGERWSSYRRKGSDIFTDDAIEENILAERNEFASSLHSALKGFSDHYRRPKRKLLSLFKDPQSINSDEMLLERVNELIDIQEHKRKYKDSSVLATRLFGKDWKFEKTNWKDLANKIQHFYAFRSRNKSSKQFDYLVHILEQWHLFKPFANDFDELQANIDTLKNTLDSICKSLNLAEPLSTQIVDLWVNKVLGWAKYWDEQDIYLELCEQMDNISDSPCENLAQSIKETDNASRDIAVAFARAWTNSQMQAATNACPELFGSTAKSHKQKGSQYKTLLDQFCNANFRAAHELVEKKPALFQCITLSKSYEQEPGSFDVALFLDADCTTIAEAMPGIASAQKTILFGSPCAPSLETLPTDACNEEVSSQSIFFKDSVLSAAIRKGIPSSVIGFTTQYADPALFSFANSNIFEHEMAQYPNAILRKDKAQTVKIVPDKISTIAEKAVAHALKNPSQTLGIVTFSPESCDAIESEIAKLLAEKSAAAKFFTQGNVQNRFYVKTVERAVDLYRDVIFVCLDAEKISNSNSASDSTTNRKLSICSTLAKQKLTVFLSSDDSDKLTNSKSELFQKWIEFLKGKFEEPCVKTVDSVMSEQIKEVLKKEDIPFKDYVSAAGIPIGPVVVDANNSKRFLAVIECDCNSSKYNESVEDREYVRQNELSRFGWKTINMWLPLWSIANADEKGNLIATIAIEQSVAPPPEEDIPLDSSEDSQESALDIEPYVVEHPSSAEADTPITEIPADKLIEQLKFYVDYESPIHGELLLQRIQELHHIDSNDAKTKAYLSETVKKALHLKQFVKTGQFFYSLENKPVKARDRSKRPDSERKIAYVSPEERALFKDEQALKQTLGIL